MSAGGYISSNGSNINVNRMITTVNNQLKLRNIVMTVKSANRVIIDNVTFFEITAVVNEPLLVLYALNGKLEEAEHLMHDYLYHNGSFSNLKFTFIK